MLLFVSLFIITLFGPMCQCCLMRQRISCLFMSLCMLHVSDYFMVMTIIDDILSNIC